MSAFSAEWAQCMRGNGFPVPDLETINEAIEFLHKLESAWENAGAGEELVIGALVAGGAFAGSNPAVLSVLGEVAQVAAAVYLTACTACAVSAALPTLRQRRAMGEGLPSFVVAELERQEGEAAGGVPA